MRRVFEGEQVRTDVDDFDFLEIRRNASYFLLSTPYFVVPGMAAAPQDMATAGERAGGPMYMAVNYYRVAPCGRRGLLEYDEFEGFGGREVRCVKSCLYSVEAPVEHQEFYKHGARYLALDVKVHGDYEVSMENGTLVKDGMLYKVFGDGCYVFRTDRILYRFY